MFGGHKGWLIAAMGGVSRRGGKLEFEYCQIELRLDSNYTFLEDFWWKINRKNVNTIKILFDLAGLRISSCVGCVQVKKSAKLFEYGMIR